jgi:hypothetical protein
MLLAALLIADTLGHYKTDTEITKELNITPVLGQNVGIQMKLVATYKQDSPLCITEHTKKTTDQEAAETRGDP